MSTTPENPGTHKELRKEMLQLLEGGAAHRTFEDAVKEFPVHIRGKTVEGIAHTPWQILEHLRLAQWDILEFCRNADHKSPPWPEGYWPEDTAPPSDTAWDESVKLFLKDRASLARWIQDPDSDLLASVPDEDGPSLLHEIVITAQHNSYHMGQLLLLRRALER